MKVQIIVFGALLIIGNVSFASQEASTQTTLKSQNSLKNIQSSIQTDILSHLVNNWLELSSAKELSSSIENISEHKINTLLQKLEDVEYTQLVEVLAKRLLHKKSVDLYDSNVLIAIAHALKGVNITPDIRHSLLSA